MLRGLFRKKKNTDAEIARLFVKAAKKSTRKTGAKLIGIRIAQELKPL